MFTVCDHSGPGAPGTVFSVVYLLTSLHMKYLEHLAQSGTPCTNASSLYFAPVCTRQAKDPLRLESPGSHRSHLASLSTPLTSLTYFQTLAGTKHTLPYPFPSVCLPAWGPCALQDWIQMWPLMPLGSLTQCSQSTGLFLPESGASRKLFHASVSQANCIQPAQSRYTINYF